MQIVLQIMHIKYIIVDIYDVTKKGLTSLSGRLPAEHLNELTQHFLKHKKSNTYLGNQCDKIREDFPVKMQNRARQGDIEEDFPLMQCKIVFFQLSFGK